MLGAALWSSLASGYLILAKSLRIRYLLSTARAFCCSTLRIAFTMRLMEIIIDKVAIWRPNLHDSFSVRIVPKGKRYIKKDSPAIIMANKPFYRYAKNYTKDDLKYCLFVRTFSDAAKRVESQMDDIAKDLKTDYIRKIVAEADEFEYLNKFVEE